ncbi:MAG: protein translocase subunit SecD [Alphaproteobacteria bacterium]
MIQIARWKIVTVLLVCFLGLAYSSPNLMSAETRSWVQKNFPDWMPTKSINLGLDLRGGAHLLFAVQLDVVFSEREDSLMQDARSALREQRIGYARIGKLDKGVRLVLRDRTDYDAAVRIMRSLGQNMAVTTQTDGLTIEARMSEDEITNIINQTIEQSIEIVRRRVDEMGTTEPSIARQGDDRILLQVPGANAEDLKRIVGTTAKLTFHLLDDGMRTGANSRSLPMLEDPMQTLNIQRRSMITGDMLNNASPSFDQNGQAVVSFRLNSQGARRFCTVSTENVGRPFAIVLDEKIISAPVIREPICGGNGQISGGFDVQSANDLALLLRAGALPAPLTVIEERTVGPSLGADSIEAGKIAALIAMVLVLVFMGMTYGLFGMMANVALLINVALIFAILSALQATLTLPGIAGIVLTMGMAVDANVLIFERIREELRAGRSPISAIDSGYSRAMTTIIDSNLTTLIAAIILFSFGTGPIKGFAVTLGVGIMTSFFAAIMVTRVMVVTWLRQTKPKTIPI